ncbi:3 beta-hydroxysteroid dehydrogenase/Delta 5--_4-isomerase-like isoform X2 [Gordionus sp. m RMFG-2023]|uniref:3 beta-hydroxysteroid dehydrogenase/Delta 5-->4-isomerase-like isoform X2 n=1 Tax=Gordionus sp. m RMFG-2023 TaxID=3053472 RepID=UPI0031FD6284
MGDVIIVIGGNGFLGHHIIQNLPKYLKTSSHYDYRSKGVMNGPQYTDFDNNTKFAANKVRKIKEVRIIDKNIKNSNYGEENLTIDVEKNIMKKAIKIPITKRKIDILNYEELAESFKDGTIVIHCASLLIADRDYLIKVNVQGTKNVIRACLQQGISILIYTSTVDVCVGMKLSIQTDLDETQSYPEIHLFPNYGGSKLEAELSVLKADGQSLQNVDTMNTNNHVMRTVCLRPCAIYGPLDPYFITESIRIGLRGNEPYFWWKKKKDMEVKYRFPRLNIGNAKIQAAYVGNIAWAHLIAVESMKMGNSQIETAYNHWRWIYSISLVIYNLI